MREPWCRIPLGDTDALDTLAAPRITITRFVTPFFFLEGGQQRGLTWRIIPVSISPQSRGFVVPLPNGQTPWLKKMGVALTTKKTSVLGAHLQLK